MKPFIRVLGIVFACGLLLPASAQLNSSTHNPHSQIEGGTDHSSMSKWPSKMNNNSSGLDGQDRQFLKTAAQFDIARVDLGNLAEAEAVNPEVKRLGQRMAGDHAKANADLRLLAQSKGVSLPQSISPETRNLQAHLAHFSGQQFEQHYLPAMIKRQKQIVADFRKEAYDLDVKKFAGKYLPIFLSHLEQTQGIEKQLSNR